MEKKEIGQPPLIVLKVPKLHAKDLTFLRREAVRGHVGEEKVTGESYEQRRPQENEEQVEQPFTVGDTRLFFGVHLPPIGHGARP